MVERGVHDVVQESLVGVVGAGTMGAGIAQVALLAGHRVSVYDKVEGAAAKAVAGLGSRLDSLAAKGRLTDDARDTARARLLVADGLEAFADAVLVIEAVVEDLDVKQRLFAGLETIVGPDCLFATNTSSLSVTAIGAALADPSRLAGMHFFNPAPLMPLVEVITGLATRPETADTVARHAEAWGKTTVRCASTPGFIVNRVARPFYAEALRAHEEGAADFATIDAVVKGSGGFKMGPFELMDMIGLDVNLAVSTSVWEATGYDPRYTPAWTQKEHVAAGRLGRKTGRGFYDYADGAAAATPAFQPKEGEKVLSDAGQAVFDGFLKLPREVAGLGVKRCTGKTATSYGDGRILIDLALDYEKASVIALAPAADANPEAVREAVAFFQTAGKEVVLVEDVPGMIVTRTVARLVNEAVDAVFRADAGEQDIDLAMRLGVNYPRGPLEWGGDLGMHWVLDVLDNLDAAYRDGRYRASPLLRQLAQADRTADAMLMHRARRARIGDVLDEIDEEARRILAESRVEAESVDEMIERLKQRSRAGADHGEDASRARTEGESTADESRGTDASRGEKQP